MPEAAETVQTQSDQTPTLIARRHDLDALRGIAMLLGIVLHGALSFIPLSRYFWPVEDSRANEFFGLLLYGIHGFRMPVFFLVSGFFTTMLWRKRGLSALLKHRFQRIFLPLLIGMLTIIPLVGWISEHVKPQATQGTITETPADIIHAAAIGDHESIARFAEEGVDLDRPNADGNSALHTAVFFGHAECVKALLDAGADTNVLDKDGRRPVENLFLPWELTHYVASLVPGLEVDKDEWAAGQKRIAELMSAPVPTPQADGPVSKNVNKESKAANGFANWFAQQPLLGHLWFLWFLCLLVVAFAVMALIVSSLGITQIPATLTVPGWRFLWLIPLTAIPQFYMLDTQNLFGPSTSLTIIPRLATLLYYSSFFFFGACYFDATDDEGRLGKYWWLLLPMSLLMLFPVGLGAMSDPNGKAVAAVAQSAYAWCLSIGMIGGFRRWLASENKVLRYLSDSSYWLYLAHIPLIIYVQFLVRDWPAAAGLKFLIVCTLTSAVLLISYQLFVRYTPIGTLLNGPRKRHQRDKDCVATVTSDQS